MHKTPRQIARSLRVFRTAHRLGLLQAVRIVPGLNACEAVRSQVRVTYRGNAVFRLPLGGCTRAICECKYRPIAGGKLMGRLREIAKVPLAKPPRLY